MVSLKTWVTSTLRRKPRSFLLAVFAFITGLDSVCRFADNSVELEGHQLLNPFASRPRLPSLSYGRDGRSAFISAKLFII
ncbi:hypothetical protein BDW60DRAFT_47136 [Aspergillus nidulans var. acristatus]